jgi:hypothetical protein
LSAPRSNPVIAATGSNDKNWTVCDDTSTSPHYGNCYTEYDITSAGDSIRMRTSTNGGASWGAALAPGGSHTGLGGQPVALPNGDVVVPYESLASSIRSFRSTNGGTSWNSTVLVSNISHHTVAGSLREEPLPSAEADATARIGLTYYYYPAASCTASTCQLDTGFISSANGGSTWSAATQLAGPMTLSWLPNTSQGRMFGDYISTSLPAGGNAYPILPIANAPTGSTFDLAMYAPNGGLAVTGGARAATPARRAAATASRFRPTIPLTAH